MYKNTHLIGKDSAVVNQILPHKEKWAWELYLKGRANNWIPQNISMAKDIEQWRGNKLSDDEKLIVKMCMGFFAGSESLVANNLLVNIYRWICDPECRTYLGHQHSEELNHNLTVVYICESLNLNPREIYNAYAEIPSIKAKDNFLMQICRDINRPDFDIDTDDGKRELLRNLITYYILCESLFFYSSFAALLSFSRRNLMPGLTEQITYTLKDECLSPDTELLTNNGWKPVTDITKETKVAQYNIEDESISFAFPIKLSKTKVDKLYHFTNPQKHIDLLVSENHRVLQPSKFIKGKYKCKTAKEAKFTSYNKHLMGGYKKDGEFSCLSPEERFLIAFQADGSLPDVKHNGKRSDFEAARFFLTKNRKKIRLKQICSECNFEFVEIKTKKPREHSYYIKTPKNFLRKTFSEWVTLDNKTVEWCKSFIEEVSHWDAHIYDYNKERVGYFSSIKSNSDIVQAIACLCNYRTHLSNKPYYADGIKKDFWRLQNNRHLSYLDGSCIKKTVVEYDGYVYGVEVPSTYIVYRRNGCVGITGNCLHIDFGTKLISRIREDYPNLWNEQFEQETVEHIKKTCELEIAFSQEAIPNGIMGLNSKMFMDYLHYLGNRRCEQIQLKPIFEEKPNPFPWLLEVIDLPKMKNFFESHVQEYSHGELEDDL